MKQNIIEVAEKMKADNLVRASLAILSSKLDLRYKTILEYTYSDPELHSIYDAYREASTYHTLDQAKYMRTLVKFPNEYVYRFLNDLFTKEYGPQWLSDKPTFLKICRREELIKPWLTVAKL